MSSTHYPVMNKEVVELLARTAGRLFVDCTLGLGGHSRLILEALPQCRLIAIDQDPGSLQIARHNLLDFSDRITFLQTDYVTFFDNCPIDPTTISGMLIDPGLSMAQLRDSERGFSHSLEGPLDMRKNPDQSLTAHQIINSWSQTELESLFREFGEFARSRELARRIIEKRLFAPISTTTELRSLVEEITHFHPAKGRLHPAALVFQALRIRINDELDHLAAFLQQALATLQYGARLIVLAYHSLEDRIVKTVFREASKSGRLQIIKPFPRFPGAAEIAVNPASRSARMRVGELL
jgi:16S rRNA (cytosine1402-N4)-methyltransferase